MLVSAARQTITYRLSHLVEGHLDTWTTKRAKVALQAFILFALHHEDILPAITHDDKPTTSGTASLTGDLADPAHATRRLVTGSLM